MTAARWRDALSATTDHRERQVPPYEGQHAFEANKNLNQDLKASGALIRHGT